MYLKVQGEDERNATFIFTNEDHTLGNSLRYILSKQFFFIIKYYCNNYICLVQMWLLLVTAFLIHMKQKCIFVYRQQVSYIYIFLQRTLYVYIWNHFFNTFFILSISLTFVLYSIFHLRTTCKASARRRSNTAERNNYSIKIKVYRSFEKRTRMS